MISLKPNDQRGKLVIGFIILCGIMDIVSFASSYLQYKMLISFESSNTISNGTAEANDQRMMVVSVLQTIIFILSAIFFIMWFRRAYANLHKRTQDLTHTEGWAAGAWFVPILNLFRPYQIMKEMYDKTIAILGLNRISGAKQLNPNWVGIWWSLWIINNIGSRIMVSMSKNADTIPELKSMTFGFMIFDIIGIILTLATIKLIYDYTKVEPLLNDAIEVQKDDPELLDQNGIF